MIVKLLNWFFNRMERGFGLYMGKDVPKEPPGYTCPVCEGDGLLESGDVCPKCNGKGKVPR